MFTRLAAEFVVALVIAFRVSLVAAFFVVAPTTQARALEFDVLWLGNDAIPGTSVFATDTSGNPIQEIPNLPTTGIAFDGSFLYFSNRAGEFTRRTPDGTTVLESFTLPGDRISEDLAWDSTRDAIWRINHSNSVAAGIAHPVRLDLIDPVTKAVQSFGLPFNHPEFGVIGGLGVAYDATRDLVYVSFCRAGCSATLVGGLVVSVDPVTLAVSDLFTTDFYIGGLAYNPGSDTLWVGATSDFHNMELDGTILSTVARPGPDAFIDGLEFIAAVPEPTAVLLLATGLAALAWRVRRGLGTVSANMVRGGA